jgi:hypothetical protein
MPGTVNAEPSNNAASGVPTNSPVELGPEVVRGGIHSTQDRYGRPRERHVSTSIEIKPFFGETKEECMARITKSFKELESYYEERIQ